MSDKLEMPIEQFAEAVAKENAQLNEHNEKMKEQTKLYFHAFNKAAARIEKLEAALREIAELSDFRSMHPMSCEADYFRIARKALEGKDD
jgi:hypothetical protein